MLQYVFAHGFHYAVFAELLSREELEPQYHDKVQLAEVRCTFLYPVITQDCRSVKVVKSQTDSVCTSHLSVFLRAHLFCSTFDPRTKR